MSEPLNAETQAAAQATPEPMRQTPGHDRPRRIQLPPGRSNSDLGPRASGRSSTSPASTGASPVPLNLLALREGGLQISIAGGRFGERWCKLSPDGRLEIYADAESVDPLGTITLSEKTVTIEAASCFKPAHLVVTDTNEASNITVKIRDCSHSHALTKQWGETMARVDGVTYVDTSASHEPRPSTTSTSGGGMYKGVSGSSIGSPMKYEAVSSAVPDTPVGPEKNREPASERLKRAVRKYINRKLAVSAPATFRTLAPDFRSKVQICDFGRLRFIGHASAARRDPPRFMHLAATREPYLDSKSYAKRVLSMMSNHWAVPGASIVISITGSAQELTIKPRLEKSFKRGLAQAALATNAWIVTGGTDSGVMSLVGKGLAEYNALNKVQCIGIAPWGAVFNRQEMEGARGNAVDILADQPNGPNGSNLEPHHTLFLLPDTGNEGGKAFGTEIVFRARLEAEYCRAKRVPRVLVVVQGGPGTLETVLQCLNEDCPVILIADSGGVAELIDLFIKSYRDKDGKYYMKGHIPPANVRPDFARFQGSQKKLETIAKKDWEAHKIHSFKLSETSTSELDVHLLNAVINDKDQCKPEFRLKLAVEWNRMDVVKQVMLEQQVKALDMRDALQTAICMQTGPIVKLLLTQTVDLVGKLDFIALHKTGERFSPLFAINTRLQDELLDAHKSESSGATTFHPTSARRYNRALSDFLAHFVPDVRERLKMMVQAENERKQKEREKEKLGREKEKKPGRSSSKRGPGAGKLGARKSLSLSSLLEESSGVRSATSINSSRSFDKVLKPPVPDSPGIDDCIVWAVLVRDAELVEAMWQTLTTHGDPIRIAVIAASTARTAARRDAIHYSTYEEHANLYLQWACSVLDRCNDKNDASYVLRRPSQHGWPHTILRVAVDTEAKQVVGHRHVQALVDDSWRGGAAGSEWALPEDTSYLGIMLHFFWPTLDICHNETGAIAPKQGWPGIWQVAITLHKHFSDPSFIGFLSVAQVKFTCKASFYTIFLVTFFLEIARHGKTGTRPHRTPDALDAVFYLQVLALWFDETYQWVSDALRGDAHLTSVWNVWDALLWSSLVAAGIMRFFVVGAVCGFEDVPLGVAGTLNASTGSLAASLDPSLTASPPAPTISPSPTWAGGYMYDTETPSWAYNPARQLRGTEISGHEDLPTSSEILHLLYHECTPLYVERIVLAFGFILASTRLLQWMMISKKLGVIALVVISLMSDLFVFSALALICVISFGGALVALMPLHGSGAFNADGAFFIPWWAMYGEFGEIELVGVNGGVSGSLLVWLYTFLVQIVLVNLLIAMMTDTYQKIQANADNEWKFQRVTIVDEFATAFYLPPPLSLPYTIYYSVRGCAMLLQGYTQYDGSSLEDEGEQLLSGGTTSQTRMLDAIPQEAVTTRLNPAPELLWMTSYLENVDQLSHTTIDHKLTELIDDRDRNLAKTLENQELLETLKNRIGENNKLLEKQAEALEKVRVASLTSGRDSSFRSQSPPELSATAPSPHSGGSREDEGSVQAAVVGRLEEALSETQQKYNEVKESRDEEIAKLRREAAIAQKEQKSSIVQLRTQLQRYQVLEAAHSKARGPHPQYPARGNVPDEYVNWRIPFEGYTPTAYTAQVVKDNDVTVKPGGWADPELVPPFEWNTGGRVSYEGVYAFDAGARPLNPRGRTGMTGRGLLGKWGPNHAADPIVTRYDPEREYVLQMVAIRRRDTSEWAIPGGMVDMGEAVSVTVRREFTEEAGAIADEEKKALFLSLADDLFASGEVVYRGYVDDPRNTDNAWMESAVFHFHCTPELGKLLPLEAGDDAASVKWLDVDDSNATFANLYASHKDFVKKAVEAMEGRDEEEEPESEEEELQLAGQRRL